ncbi:hypothetical protein QAD02_021596 [Eretmocerus hayati]|uniref:Uncharacterized protein n=1 Tax=Eretmocerus hayati TaxID=131215 RepID=A0ACC2PRQ7_9HYME|nr:hypothetical protein QAD02_021596 [Eretmocerus hayati]
MNTRSGRGGGTRAMQDSAGTTPAPRSRARGQMRSSRGALPIDVATGPIAAASQPADLSQEGMMRRLREDEEAHEQHLRFLQMQVEVTQARQREVRRKLEQQLEAVHVNNDAPGRAQLEHAPPAAAAEDNHRLSESDSSSVLQQLAALQKAVARIEAQSSTSSQMSDELESMNPRNPNSSDMVHDTPPALPHERPGSTPAQQIMPDAAAVTGTSDCNCKIFRELLPSSASINSVWLASN